MNESKRLKLNENQKRYYARNREKCLEMAKVYSEKNKEKISARNKAWRESHKEKSRLSIIAWRSENKDYRKQYAKSYRSVHGKEMNESVKVWYKAHPSRVLAMSAKKRADRFNATPPWVNRKEIEKIYALSLETTRITGIKHEVDHLWPINGVGFRGLHVPWNLRVIPSSENAKKSNRRPDFVPSHK